MVVLRLATGIGFMFRTGVGRFWTFIVLSPSHWDIGRRAAGSTRRIAFGPVAVALTDLIGARD